MAAKNREEQPTMIAKIKDRVSPEIISRNEKEEIERNQSAQRRRRKTQLRKAENGELKGKVKEMNGRRERNDTEPLGSMGKTGN
ncbi:hypothetical protein ACFX13_034848 [Malus domestica]